MESSHENLNRCAAALRAVMELINSADDLHLVQLEHLSALFELLSDELETHLKQLE